MSSPGGNDNFLIFLPYRESRRSPYPALPRDRSKLLRLHPWRLGSGPLRLLQRWGLFNRMVKYYCKPVVPRTHNGTHYAVLFLEDKIREPETNSRISTD
jgi:hypothetical protein